jgi:hypothetical protein
MTSSISLQLRLLAITGACILSGAAMSQVSDSQLNQSAQDAAKLTRNVVKNNAALATTSTPLLNPSWSDYATATTTAYCLAKHPIQTGTAKYTHDGYEYASWNPAIVGSVRRNFMYGRDSAATSDPNAVTQTCQQACGQMGKLYEPTYKGAALTRKVGTTVVSSGMGDIAALAMQDKDFYLGTTVVAGQWTRVQSFQESDVAQADMCCCHVVPATP